MKRKVIVTGDGSKTIQIEDWNEQYHSVHGAIQEAYHVFIQSGLHQLPQKNITILEMGFGTGLNALITYSEAEKLGLHINYTGIEAHPVTSEELVQLNHVSALGQQNLAKIHKAMHSGLWEQKNGISSFFSLTKQQMDFLDLDVVDTFDLVYFDAFGPRVQPHLWTINLFSKVYRATKTQGIFVTYSAKGSVRRNLEAVGFFVERLPGPPGKREMLRARKL